MYTNQLPYRRPSGVGPWLDLVAAKGEVFVQFWLRPGETAVFFDPGDEPPADPIPAELRAVFVGWREGGDAGGGGWREFRNNSDRFCRGRPNSRVTSRHLKLVSV